MLVNGPSGVRRTVALTALLLVLADPNRLLGQEGTQPALAMTVSGEANRATVSWLAATGALSYTIERRTLSLDRSGRMQSATGFTALATQTGTRYGDVLPTPSVTYEYRVNATFSGGRVYTGPTVQYLAPPFTTPTGLAITGLGLRADLTWAPATGVLGYHVWRRTVRPDGMIVDLAQRTSQLLATPGLTDGLAAAGETYEYQVVSQTSDGRTWPSIWVRYTAPAAVAPVVAVGGVADRAVLTWTATAGASGYHVVRHTLDAAGRHIATVRLTAAPLAMDGFTDVIPAPSAYEYQVTAVLPDGSLLASQPVRYATPPFTTPSDVVAAAAGTQSVVAWSPAVGTGVVGYHVWRRLVRADGAVIEQVQRTAQPVTATVFHDGLSTTGVSVEYQILALTADGRTWPSSWVRAATAIR